MIQRTVTQIMESHRVRNLRIFPIHGFALNAECLKTNLKKFNDARFVMTILSLKVITYTLLIPGLVLGLVPYIILRQSGHLELPEASVLSVFASFLLLISSGFLGYCIYEFASQGRGTLAPIDPPKSLVVKGSYSYTRNPMYVAIICILLSEVILFRTIGILIYFLMSVLAIHLFVLFYEEPHLRKLFGREYEDYCQSVPRWWIARQPFSGIKRGT